MHWALLQGKRMLPDWGADHATGKAVTCLQLPFPPLGLCSYNFPITSSYFPCAVPFRKCKDKIFFIFKNKDQGLESRNLGRFGKEIEGI